MAGERPAEAQPQVGLKLSRAMASRAAWKKLAELRASPYGRSHKDLRSVYTGFGFVSSEGKHGTVYKHEADPAQFIAQVPRHSQLPPVYARTALKLIDKLTEELGLEET